jgi:peptidoglycan/LPS O-acetylase OafA/YrhL
MKHYKELDSLRGLAALTVVMAHITGIIGSLPIIVKLLPISIIFSAHQAVIFFFILSGFVLTLPFVNGKHLQYSSFIIKRIFRIYIPYIIAILLSFLLCIYIGTNSITGLGEWFNNKWINPIPINIFFEHIFLIGNYETTTYNPVVWSLIHEMRISIIFPVWLFLIRRFSWRVSLFIGILLTAMGILNNIFGFNVSKGYNSSWFDTLHYISMFIVGGLIAKHLKELSELYSRIKQKVKTTYIVAVVLVLYTYSNLIYEVPKKLELQLLSNVTYYISDWLVAIAGSSLIVIVLADRWFSKGLNNKGLVLIGNLSFSIYLLHTTILFSMFHLLGGSLNNWIIILLSLILLFPIAYLNWLFVEKNSIKLGKIMSSRFINSVKGEKTKENIQKTQQL